MLQLYRRLIASSKLTYFLLGMLVGCFAALSLSSMSSLTERLLIERETDGREAVLIERVVTRPAPTELVQPVEDSDEDIDREFLQTISEELDANKTSEVVLEEEEDNRQAMLFPPVSWDDVEDKYKLSETRILEQKRLWRAGKADKPLFFFYQPTGGWGNQRYDLMWAIIAANAMNRTLILPPIAPHSNLWIGFNKWKASALLPMARVLNIEALDRVVTRGVLSFNDTIYSLKRYLPRLNILTYRRPENAGWWSFQRIRADWMTRENLKYDVVFWEKDSMWCCCGATGPYKDYYARHVMFNAHIKELGKNLIRQAAYDARTNPNATYNAVHVRRGDHVTGDRRTPQRYFKEHSMDRFDRRFPLYIATDEQDHTWFDVWQQKQSMKRFTRMIFWKDLRKDWIDEELKNYPVEMYGDVLGFLEMIICAFARRWEGSKGSTFSSAIARARTRKEVRAIHFDWPAKPPGSE